jgi:hypothetical protein
MNDGRRFLIIDSRSLNKMVQEDLLQKLLETFSEPSYRLDYDPDGIFWLDHNRLS